VTIASDNLVQVRPVNLDSRGKLAAIRSNATTAWYDPRNHDADFLLLPQGDARPGTLTTGAPSPGTSSARRPRPTGQPGSPCSYGTRTCSPGSVGRSCPGSANQPRH
jgi:hypothetical protein